MKTYLLPVVVLDVPFFVVVLSFLFSQLCNLNVTFSSPPSSFLLFLSISYISPMASWKALFILYWNLLFSFSMEALISTCMLALPLFFFFFFHTSKYLNGHHPFILTLSHHVFSGREQIRPCFPTQEQPGAAKSVFLLWQRYKPEPPVLELQLVTYGRNSSLGPVWCFTSGAHHQNHWW